ncbi:hypothetical protein [Streptomyces sp. F001]|uniref:hypothetical protein n=1 Tax=Streptomyces sp. F001 TaxID=1510026 RepID=UPI00320A7B17
MHVIPRWGTTPLDRIRFEDIAEWLADMLSGEATGSRELSPRSVRKAYRWRRWPTRQVPTGPSCCCWPTRVCAGGKRPR